MPLSCSCWSLVMADVYVIDLKPEFIYSCADDSFFFFDDDGSDEFTELMSNCSRLVWLHRCELDHS